MQPYYAENIFEVDDGGLFLFEMDGKALWETIISYNKTHDDVKDVFFSLWVIYSNYL